MTDSSSPVAGIFSCGCLLLLFVFSGVAVFVMMSFVKRMAPYNVAINSVKSSPEAIVALGEPINESWFVSGGFKFQGSKNGETHLSIPVSGPKDRGKVYVEGKKENGVWSYEKLELDIDGKRIRLRPKPLPESQPEVAPAPEPGVDPQAESEAAAAPTF